MGTTPAAKACSFCLVFIVHAAQIFNRTITLSLLAATQPWWVPAYLGGDFLVLVLYKAVRRDLLCWLPGCNVPQSLLYRFSVKAFTDSTACVQFRNAVDFGGMYYCVNAVLSQACPPARVQLSDVVVLPSQVRPCRTRSSIRASAQVAAFASVALYAACYVGEAKLAASTLYAVVGTLVAVWALSFGVLLLTMERKYVRTFFSTKTGCERVMSHFLDADSDELRAEIFECNEEMWRPIRAQVQAWVRSRFKSWKRERPAWFTDATCASIPTDLLTPRDARRLIKQAGGLRTTIHRASLSHSLSLRLLRSAGVHAAPAVTLSRVMPTGRDTAAAEPASGASSSDSESDSESESEPESLSSNSGAETPPDSPPRVEAAMESGSAV
jgi:hypothetical protein